MGHNGWTNYETWNVALWIDNEEGSHRERCDMARRARSASDLADRLKDWVTEMAPDLGASMFSDLLSAALSEVNWDEIAGNWYEEAHEDEVEEEEETT
jgi:ketopantoate reductase